MSPPLTSDGALRPAPALAPAPPSVPVLVTDAEQRSALAVTRSLARAGHTVHLCASVERPLAGASRYATTVTRVPDPLAEPEQYARAVAALAQRVGARVLVPMTDQSSEALLQRRGTLDDVAIAAPDFAAYNQCSDKAALATAAAQVGIATPRQIALASPADGEALASGQLPFPVVIKPSRSVRAGRRFPVRFAADAAQLRDRLRQFPAEAYPILLQERIVGPGVGVFLLLWEGQALARFSHVRLREYPPCGGASVYCESVALPEDLAGRSQALLELFGWRGVAMVEYKVDARTGVPYLIEVNGRFWGSLQLAIDAGVDFPALLVSAVLGHPTAGPVTWRAGVRLRSWWRDVSHLGARLRGTPAALDLPPDAPSRWRVVRDFLRWRRGDRNEVLHFDDPRPFARETLAWLRRR